ncbi:MAG: A/G-specific adenine glycosylase [Bryobacteraceae bacterium]
MQLRKWYRRVRRDLPWRQTQDPYRIWVSEIMLQQTRVATVVPYYERFLARFPTVDALAAAPEPELLTAWAGLGYYARARNLQRAARVIVERGGFPRDYGAIRELPGVGDYTAAAIASIAFGLPHAVLDGNVARVLSRVFNESGDIRLSATRRRLQHAADELLDRRNPAESNQALMELGATICLPRQPRCAICPIAESCEARRLGVETERPVKARAKETVFLRQTLILIRKRGRILLFKRPPASARMPGFWDVPESGQIPDAVAGALLGTFRHSITNHIYRFEVRSGDVVSVPKGFRWVRESRLDEIPLSTTAKKALLCLKRCTEPRS